MSKLKVLCRTAKLRDKGTGEEERAIIQYFTELVEFRSEPELRKIYTKLIEKEDAQEKVLRLQQTMLKKIEESKKNHIFLQQLNQIRNELFVKDMGLDVSSYKVKSDGDVNKFQGKKTLELVVERTEIDGEVKFDVQKRAVWNGKLGFDSKRFRPFKFDIVKPKSKDNGFEIVEEEADHYDLSNGREQGRMLIDAIAKSPKLCYLKDVISEEELSKQVASNMKIAAS